MATTTPLDGTGQLRRQYDGGRRPAALQLPPEIPQVEISTAAAHYNDLVRQAQTARVKLAEAEDAREKAIEADRQALADARRAGKRDPGRQAIATADQQILDARRELEALQIAVADQAAELARTVAQHRAELEEAIDGRFEQTRQQLAEQIEQLAGAHHAYAEAAAARAWAREFPGRSVYRPHGGQLADLLKPNGEPMPFTAALESMRAFAQPTPSDAPTPAGVQLIGGR